MASKREGGVLEPGRSWRSKPCSYLDGHSCQLLAAASAGSGVALLPQGRQKWPESGGTARAEPAAPGPAPRTSRRRSPGSRVPRAPPAIASCPLSPSPRLCTRGLLALLADTSSTGSRGFSPRYSICFQESCVFFCSEEGFIGEGEAPVSRCKLCPHQKA